MSDVVGHRFGHVVCLASVDQYNKFVVTRHLGVEIDDPLPTLQTPTEARGPGANNMLPLLGGNLLPYSRA